MRQINLILSGLLALSVGFAGCSSEEPLGSTDTTPGTPGTGTPVSFSAAFSSEYDGNIKKLAYGTVDAQTSMNWTANDHIRIWSSMDAGSSAQGVYATATGGDPAEFAHVGSTEITWASDISSSQPQQFQAFFPGNATTTGFSADGKARFTVPATQHLTAANGYGMDNVLLYDATTAESESDNIAFEFENVVTVLKLVLPSNIQDNEGNTITIEHVTVRAIGTNAEKIASTFTAATAGDSPVDDFASFDVDDASKSNIITVSADDWTTSLYVTLAPHAYEKLMVTIVGTDGSGISEIVSTAGIAERRLYPIEKNPLKWRDKVVNMGIWVVSNTALDGIRTEWISNGTVAWDIDVATGKAIAATAVNPIEKAKVSTVKQLYWATGNLHVSADPEADLIAGNWGIIAPVSETSIELGNGTTTGYGHDAKGFGLYGWGDPFGNMNSIDRNHYPLNDGDHTWTTRPEHISGSKWDIAKHQLGDAWRLPTAVELFFLMETSNAMPTSGTINSYTETSGYDGHYYNYITAPWRSADNDKHGYLITSTATTNSIFLPALGVRASSSITNRGAYGQYRSGSFFNASGARSLMFDNSIWVGQNLNRHAGQAVRPVSEL